MASTRIGLISDTHGLLRPEALDVLAGCELILHAGDVGGPDILAALRRVAPVVAVRGNVDAGPWAEALRVWETVDVAGIRVHLRHIRQERAIEGVDVVVTGHSHRPSVERIAGVLHVNPGSAGPRRFQLPISVALLAIEGGKADATIVELTPA